MPRWSCLLLLSVWTVVGCGGQTNPEQTPEPQTVNKKPVDKHKGADRTREALNTDTKRVTGDKVVFLYLPEGRSFHNCDITAFKIEGDLKDKHLLGGFQIKNIQALEGTLPATGTYYLRAFDAALAVGNKKEEQGFVDVAQGAFFDKKLPAGTRLANVVRVGKCKADLENPTGPDGVSSMKGLPFNVYEATVERK